MEHEQRPIRAFIAIHPAPHVQTRVEQLQAELRRELTPRVIRWARPDQLHITLQFLGNIERSRLPDFCSAVAAATQQQVELRVANLGCFPSALRPRVLWVGVTGQVALLQQLKLRLDEHLQPLGYEPETREYHPHITLARIGPLKPAEREAMQQCIARLGSTDCGSWTVMAVDLMRSHLSPHGARYEVIQSFKL